MNERPADRLAIAVAQLNPIVGDVSGNLERARKARAQAAREGADIVAFSELFIAGYPPEDLVLKPAFQAACRAAVEDLARDTADGGPAVLIGTPWVEDGKLYNAYALLAGGRIEAIRFKVNLPNYGVFDEKRVFAAGPVPGPSTTAVCDVHLVRADLQLDPLAARPDDRGVDRAIIVLLRRRDIVLEAPRHARPGRMRDANRGVTVGNRVDENAKAVDIRQLLEGDGAALHLAPDGIGLLLASLDFDLDAAAGELVGKLRRDAGDDRAVLGLQASRRVTMSL